MTTRTKKSSPPRGGRLKSVSLLLLVVVSTSCVTTKVVRVIDEVVLNPFEDVDLVCRIRSDTPFTTPGVGAFYVADCQDKTGREYEFILPGEV